MHVKNTEVLSACVKIAPNAPYNFGVKYKYGPSSPALSLLCYLSFFKDAVCTVTSDVQETGFGLAPGLSISWSSATASLGLRTPTDAISSQVVCNVTNFGMDAEVYLDQFYLNETGTF